MNICLIGINTRVILKVSVARAGSACENQDPFPCGKQVSKMSSAMA